MSTLRYTQRLEEAGFNRRQSEEIVTIQQDAMNDTFATKHDLGDLRSEMRSEFKSLRSEMAAEFKALRFEMGSESRFLRTELYGAIQALESRMTLKFGAMQVVSVGIILAALQYLR